MRPAQARLRNWANERLSGGRLGLLSAPSMSEPQRAPDLGAEPAASTVRQGEAPPPSSEPPSGLQSTGSGLWWRIGGVVRTVRPHQWVKNVFVLAPVVFAKEVFDRNLLEHATAAFFVFCLLAGAVYA